MQEKLENVICIIISPFFPIYASDPTFTYSFRKYEHN
jgi:hypothetical protein